MTKEWVHRTFTVPEGDSSSKQQMVTTNKVCVEVPSNVSHEKEKEKETTTIEEEGEIQSNENATEVPESHDTRDPGPDDNTANTPDIVAETEITESSNLGNQNAIIEVIETDEDSAIQVEDVGKEGNANVNAMANTDTIMTINPSTTEAEDIVIEEESNLRDVIKAKETPIVADAGSGRKQQLKDNSKKGSKDGEDVDEEEVERDMVEEEAEEWLPPFNTEDSDDWREPGWMRKHRAFMEEYENFGKPIAKTTQKQVSAVKQPTPAAQKKEKIARRKCPDWSPATERRCAAGYDPYVGESEHEYRR
ncbi:hypothetical protein K7X08_021809 [Anisodus acutangulus]|uniref:Uncharacterized protein n=1 Tax=Anisodus acutangulus TaxID=402998 RepID=A0A9Q1L2N9_9SOLA|nr:hypothetical protein K7X08_021809 [Anisodus acutangulus]